MFCYKILSIKEFCKLRKLLQTFKKLQLLLQLETHRIRMLYNDIVNNYE